jgi:hypothetical protein
MFALDLRRRSCALASAKLLKTILFLGTLLVVVFLELAAFLAAGLRPAVAFLAAGLRPTVAFLAAGLRPAVVFLAAGLRFGVAFLGVLLFFAVEVDLRFEVVVFFLPFFVIADAPSAAAPSAIAVPNTFVIVVVVFGLKIGFLVHLKFIYPFLSHNIRLRQ